MVLILLVLILLQCQWDFWHCRCVNTIIGRARNLGCFPILWGKRICGQICAGVYIHYSEAGEALRLLYLHFCKWWSWRVSVSFMIDIVLGVWPLKGISGKQSVRRWEDVIPVKHLWSTSRGDRYVSSDNVPWYQSDLTHWDAVSLLCVFLQNGVVVQTDFYRALWDLWVEIAARAGHEKCGFWKHAGLLRWSWSKVNKLLSLHSKDWVWWSFHRLLC